MREVPLSGVDCLRDVLRNPSTRGTGVSSVRRGKEAWPFYRTISGVRLCWELEQPKGPPVILGVLRAVPALVVRQYATNLSAFVRGHERRAIRTEAPSAP